MKRLIVLPLALLLLAPQGAFAAGLLMPALGQLRSLLKKAPALIVPVHYEVIFSEAPKAAVVRMGEGNLKEVQLDVLVAQMEEADKNANSGRTTLTDAQLRRMVGVMFNIDTVYVETVSTHQWRGISAKMADTARAELDGGQRDWDLIIDNMLKTVVGELNNMYSTYMNPAEFETYLAEMHGSYSGIGAVLSAHEKGAKVDFPFPDSPAERDGIQDGDLITHVDGEDVAGKPLDEIVRRIMGVEDTDVSLTIERGAGVLKDPIVVTRGAVERRTILAKMVAADIGYIHLSDFSLDGLAEKLFAEIDALLTQGARKLIFDVRGNPGGRVDYVSLIASEFFTNGQAIVVFKKQGGVTETNVTVGDGIFSHIPTVVLVNGGSSSASEILAGAFQDHNDKPVVIGSLTGGKGSAQIVLPGNNGRALRITESRWYTPDDRAIDSDHDAAGAKIKGTGGITPDITVEVDETLEAKILKNIFYETNGRAPVEKVSDPVLEKAVEVLGRVSAS